MLLTICCFTKDVYKKVSEYFLTVKKIYNIEINIVHGDITSFSHQVIATAGNSFGIMDGGIDKTINYTMSIISHQVQNIIQTKYFGECHVGESFLVPVTHQKFKYLCYVPTMRIPENVSHTINAYLSLRSLLITCIKNNINSIIVPLFCAGAGEMPVQTICKQYEMAITSLYYNFSDWKVINNFHKLLID